MKEVEYNEDIEECIIVGLDGCLAYVDGNSNGTIDNAPGPIEYLLDDSIANIIAMHHSHGYRVIIITYRHSSELDSTEDWLNEHNVPYDEIYARSEGQEYQDIYSVKENIYYNHIKDRYNVNFVIDNDSVICNMWKNNGLKVLKVERPND